MIKAVVSAAIGALSLWAVELPTSVSARSADDDAPVRGAGRAGPVPPSTGPVRHGGPAVGRMTLIRAVVREHPRSGADEPAPVSLFSAERRAPAVGCTVRTNTSRTPFGWRKTVTVRTCYER